MEISENTLKYQKTHLNIRKQMEISENKAKYQKTN